MQQGGVTVNDRKADAADTFDRDDFAGDGLVIKKGKKVYHRARI